MGSIFYVDPIERWALIKRKGMFAYIEVGEIDDYDISKLRFDIPWGMWLQIKRAQEIIDDSKTAYNGK